MKRIKNYLVLLLVFLLSACTSPTEQPQATSSIVSGEKVEVHFLDVGQADSTLIKLPTGENILIDGGNRDDKDYILDYLSRVGVEHIDVMVATHPHEDHIGSLKDVLSAVDTDTILLPNTDADTMVYTNLLYAIEESGAKEERILGQGSMEVGDVLFEILGPVKEYDDKNNSSIVIKMTHGENSFLFTGDIEKEAESDILETGVSLRADVLKVAHHGSKTSSIDDFLEAVSPDIAVIHVGTDNTYGLPSDITIEKLNSMNLQLYRTDLNKEIVIYSDGENLEVKCSFEEIDEDKIPDFLDSETEANQIIEEPKSENQVYIGNINSKILHSGNCGSLPAEKNQVYFETIEEAEDAGYSGHKSCIK